MGLQVIARCECGLEEEISVGGGMMDFTTNCSFPCLCTGCHSVVEANLLDTAMSCPKCGATPLIPYDDPRLAESTGQKVVAQWNVGQELGRELMLTDGNYLCPACGRMSLRFADTGLCWD